jgi:ABC-type multidrug transport system fused ATPase/permease subunit
LFKFEYLKEIYSLVGSNRGKLPKILVIFIIASLFDIVGIGLIGPYIALVISPDIDNKALIEIINILGISADQNSLLTTLGIVMVFIFLVKSILAVYINKIIIRYSLDVMGDVRSQLMSAYQTMPYKEYLSRNSSEYIYNIQSVTSQFSIQSLQALLYIISNSVVMIAILALLAWQDLAALTLFAFLLIFSK